MKYLATILLTALLTTMVPAQRPDFTGIWHLDRERSEDLTGNLGRGVIKISSVPADRRVIDAPAAVFESQADFTAAFDNLKVDVEAEINRYRELAETIRPFVTETVSYLHNQVPYPV